MKNNKRITELMVDFTGISCVEFDSILLKMNWVEVKLPDPVFAKTIKGEALKAIHPGDRSIID
jgi:hypothetical protein